MVELENKILKEKFNEVGEEMTRLEAQLDRMNTFTTKLRMMTKLEEHKKNAVLHSELASREFSLEGAAGSEHGMTEVSSYQASTYFPFFEEDSHYILPKLYELERRLKHISRTTSRDELSLHNLYEIVQDQHLLLRSTPSIMPARGWVSSRFGFRRDPFTGLRRMHAGLDIATFKGAPIYAPADGTVTYTGYKPGYGKIIIINHGYGVITRYGHISKHVVRMKDEVKRGDIIALVGSTGRSTNSHLHYEVRINEIPVDPQNFILDEKEPSMTATTKQYSL